MISDFERDSFEFEDEMFVKLNEDCSVSVFNDEGKNYTISGFISTENCKSFVMFGDFDERNNDYLMITKSKEKLTWKNS